MKMMPFPQMICLYDFCRLVVGVRLEMCVFLELGCLVVLKADRIILISVCMCSVRDMQVLVSCLRGAVIVKTFDSMNTNVPCEFGIFGRLLHLS